MTADPTVESWDAVVRTVRIGPRQLTAGIYGQLDSTYPYDLRALGRVRPPRPRPGVLYVIGRTPDRSQPSPEAMHAAPWVLARSWMPTTADEADRTCWRQDPCRTGECVCSGRTLHTAGQDGGPSIYERWRRLPLVVLGGVR